jgi:hypothetical protein
MIFQPIEGYRTARLAWGTPNAQPITIGFWSSHNRTGSYSVAVVNGSSTRSYAAVYTQTAANVAQYNTVTIPGDTAGTWASDNTIGMFINFTLAAGSTYVAPAANTWAAGYYLAVPGQVNGVAATSDIFRITGVVILPGIEAPSAARSALIMRPFDQELVTCQRYYWQGRAVAMKGVVLTGTGPAGLGMPMHVPMRATPSLSIASGTIDILDGGGGGGSINGITTNASTADEIHFTPTLAGGSSFSTAGRPVFVSYVSAGILKADARL